MTIFQLAYCKRNKKVLEFLCWHNTSDSVYNSYYEKEPFIYNKIISLNVQDFNKY